MYLKLTAYVTALFKGEIDQSFQAFAPFWEGPNKRVQSKILFQVALESWTGCNCKLRKKPKYLPLQPVFTSGLTCSGIN